MLPVNAGGKLTTIPAWSLLRVVGEYGSYYYVQYGDLEGYLPKTGCSVTPITTAAVEAQEFYVQAETALYQQPLYGSQATGTLKQGTVYSTSAVASNGWYYVETEDGTGYVPSDAITFFGKGNSSFCAVIVPEGTLYYTRPDNSFLAGQNADRTVVLLSDAEANGFRHLWDEGLYLKTTDVQRIGLNESTVKLIYATEDTPVWLTPSDKGTTVAFTMAADTVCSVSYSVGDYALIKTESGYGFVYVKADTLTVLSEGTAVNRTAAVLKEAARLIGTDGTICELPEGEPLFISEVLDGFILCTARGITGYLKTDASKLASVSCVTLIGSDAELDGYQVTLTREAVIRSFPDSRCGEDLCTVPAGQTVKIQAANRCWLLAEWNGIQGYIMGAEDLLAEETTELPLTEDGPSYELVLDKNTRYLYAFVLDEDGNRTEEIAVYALVAIGKSTTPTPSGTFTLGNKERRHRFTNSFTPFTVEYVSKRYIHGLPCYVTSGLHGVDKVIPWLAKSAGNAVSGGCLRSPIAIARWVYLNCPSYQTKLVVVNGGVNATISETSINLSD